MAIGRRGIRGIVVRIQVHRDDAAPYTKTFSSAFIDSIRIVDAAGNSIGTSPSAVSSRPHGRPVPFRALHLPVPIQPLV